MPRLSILMSAYKSEATIKAATLSTLRAMPRDAELVVTLDGPGQEASHAVLDTIADRRLRVDAHPVNLGLAGQLRRMCQETDSELVGRMDTDDISLPWRFAATMARLGRSDFVFTSAIRFGAGISPRPSYPLPLNATETARALVVTTPLFHPSMVARRKVLERVGGYEDMPYGEDHELWVRAAARGARLEKIALPGICYRLSAGQMSQSSGGHGRLEADERYARSYAELLDHLGVPFSVAAGSGVVRPDLDLDTLERFVAPCRVQQRRYVRGQAALLEAKV